MFTYLKKFRTPHPVIVGIIFAVSVASIVWWVQRTTDTALDIADERLYEARVIEVVSEEEVVQSVSGRKGIEQLLLLEVDYQGSVERAQALNDLIPVDKGTRVLVQGTISEEPEAQLYVVDVIRTRGLLWIAIAFAAMLLVVAGMYGAYALTGLIFSFAVIFNGIIPAILEGYPPVVVGLAGALLILVVTLYVSHGFNRKSLSAFAGIALALLIVGVTASIAVDRLYFTGFSAEEAVYLNIEAGDSLNLVGLVVAGIIIAAIGVLDDIAISQAATVFTLASVDPSLRGMNLFRKAMSVGRDHISAVINTLVLAYTGAALPLILLLTIRQFPLGLVINGEIVAEEIVRTLISSAGLILAVPLTTWIAVWLAQKTPEKAS